jgi:hypothetical protein
VTITNQLVCGPSPASATLLIRKFVMVNGATTPSSPTTLPAAWQTAFPITITCGSHPPFAGNLNGANTYQTSIAASVGQTCTVQEAVPTFPLPNCHWSVSYPQGPSVAIVGGGEHGRHLQYAGLSLRGAHRSQAEPASASYRARPSIRVRRYFQ